MIGVGIVYGPTQNLIGGVNATPDGSCTGACNLISGNRIGVGIDGAGAQNNIVSGNYIGTNISGTCRSKQAGRELSWRFE